MCLSFLEPSIKAEEAASALQPSPPPSSAFRAAAEAAMRREHLGLLMFGVQGCTCCARFCRVPMIRPLFNERLLVVFDSPTPATASFSLKGC